MRVVKEATIRRNEILDAAERLFVIKGYDNTSTNDILSEVGIARGTLYYHFKSKEEILNGIIERINGSIVNKAKQITSLSNVPVLERLTMMFLSMKVNSDLGDEVLKEVHKPQNALMHQKMQESLLSGLIPIITKLLKEGIEEGICNTDYPEETAEMLLLYSSTAFDDLKRGDEKSEARKIEAFIYNLERLLRMPQESMKEVIAPIFHNNR